MLLHFLVDSGLTSFLWSGPPLSVLHLVAAGASRFVPTVAGMGPDETDFAPDGEPRPMKGPWEGARAFWYQLTSGA